MAKLTPGSISAPLANVAKADALDTDGNFTINDLLQNDAGGVQASSFFFGTAVDQGATAQAAYMASHGITYDAITGVYHFDNTTALSFDYMVQTAQGTWTTAHVDIGHAGTEFFSENFDTYTTADPWADATAILVGNGWTNLGAGDEVVNSSYAGPLIQASSGDYWLDTQASPGGIDLSHTFIDTTGGTAQLSFDIGLQAFEGHATDPNSTFEFRVDGNVVKTIHATDISGPDQLQHFDVVFNTGAAGVQHTLEIVDTTQNSTDGNVGFALDSVSVHDWVI
jgi:hypothetical protein